MKSILDYLNEIQTTSIKPKYIWEKIADRTISHIDLNVSENEFQSALREFINDNPYMQL
jgi:hypothetical protein